MTGPLALFLGVLLAVGASRLYELRRSKRNVEGLQKVGGAETGPALYRLMVSVHVLLFVLPPLEVLALSRAFSPVGGGIALAVTALATWIRWHAITTLGKTWTASAVVAKDMPIVTDRGLYRWIRHPNYLGVLLEMPALPLVHGAWLSALVLGLANTLVVAVRIRQEERALFEIPGYREAMGGKARLIPGVV